MVRTFHSKVDGWYWSLMTVTAVLLFVCFWRHETWLMLLTAVGMIFEIEMLVHTCYRIVDGQWLLVESGRFVRGRQVALDAIVRIRKVRTYGVAPALSARRLQIDYRKADGQLVSVLVSPQNEEDFLHWIVKKNNLLIIE